MTDSCNTCFFFRTFNIIKRGSTTQTGVCARNAPVTGAAEQDVTGWPEIRDPLNWWCGEFSSTQIVQSINAQTASYTAALGDANNIIEMNVAGANTLTIPPNATAAFVIGTTIDFVQIGAGQTTLTPGVGVTIHDRNGLKLVAQYSLAVVYKRGTDEWVAGGDLTP